MNLRVLEERIFKTLMYISIAIVIGSLVIIIGLVIYHGAPSITFDIITKTPTSADYVGQGTGGILNAIVGSILLALPATAIAFIIGIGIALYLQNDFSHSIFSTTVRFILDVLWGIPSILYGTFIFIIMILIGMRQCLLTGILALTLLEIPIITRYMDESIKMVPMGLKESSYSLGSTKFETAVKIVRRQAFPGILAGVLLGLGRGIGDAAAPLFTAGYSNNLPGSVFDGTASMPVLIFKYFSSPYAAVRERAYAAAFILFIIVLFISIITRTLTRRYKRHLIK
ncbi:MAG TPA: phosphate ABC transporter permease PstA [Candidatus Thermoplasmatota archaeon]|nr:phosphate ABC transporter permease PstA [Candidatus Thermoplasmatota archaeon]